MEEKREGLAAPAANRDTLVDRDGAMQPKFIKIKSYIESITSGSVLPNHRHRRERRIMPKTKDTVLVVDDEPIYVEVLKSFLAPDYNVISATCASQALAILERTVPDLVLLDVVMPGMGGYELCRILKLAPSTAHIPVIFVTVLGDIEGETRGFDAGAIDYVTKPFNPVVVRARVRNHVALKRAHDELARLASTDALTGLASRRRFDELLEMVYRQHARSAIPMSLIMIDIDHFKAFNDTYGHSAGDECLRRVGGVLSNSVRRGSDLAARYGGEEFACILPETNDAGALVAARNIHKGIADLGIPHLGSATALCVTASLGVITAVCSSRSNETDLLCKVDKLLYRAKDEGRNRIVSAVECPESVAITSG